jgi:hypothetical protein
MQFVAGLYQQHSLADPTRVGIADLRRLSGWLAGHPRHQQNQFNYARYAA